MTTSNKHYKNITPADIEQLKPDSPRFSPQPPPTIIDRFCEANLNIIVKSWQHLDYESQMRIMQIVTQQQTVQITLPGDDYDAHFGQSLRNGGDNI